MLPRTSIPNTEISSTNKMMSKFYESIVCPMTRRGKEVYKYARNGAIIGGTMTLGLAEAGVGFKYIRVRSTETCNYERDNANFFNCTFDLQNYPVHDCRTTGPSDWGDGSEPFFPLTCFNDTNNTVRTALIFNASDYGDTISSNWYHVKAPEVALWTPFLGMGVGAVVGGIYGFFKELPLQSSEDERSESLLRNSR